MATKQELHAELQALGVDVSPEATYREMQTLLKENKPTPEQPERLQAPSNLPEQTQEGDDYLRPFQYRKGTKPGSVESDPQPGSKAEIMKKKLLLQPRVRTFIPRPFGEDKSIDATVTLNGYRLDLPKGSYIDVPEQVSRVIMESQQQTEEAVGRGQIAGDSEKENALS